MGKLVHRLHNDELVHLAAMGGRWWAGVLSVFHGSHRDPDRVWFLTLTNPLFQIFKPLDAAAIVINTFDHAFDATAE